MKSYDWFANRIGKNVRVTTLIGTKTIPIKNYDDVAKFTAISTFSPSMTFEDTASIHISESVCTACEG